MTGKFLGKITRAEYGQDKDRPFLFGLFLTFETPSFGICGTYATNIDEECKWDYPEQRAEYLVKNIEKINKILEDAKCSYVSELKGKPVEITVDGNLFKDFRILTEVL